MSPIVIDSTAWVVVHMRRREVLAVYGLFTSKAAATDFASTLNRKKVVMPVSEAP